MAYRSLAWATSRLPVWAMVPSSARSARGLAGSEVDWSSVWEMERNSEQVERLGILLPCGSDRVRMIAPAVRMVAGWGSDAISTPRKSGSPTTQGRDTGRKGLPSLGERDSPAPCRFSYRPAVSCVSPSIPRKRPGPDRPASAQLPYLRKKAPEKHRPHHGVCWFTIVGVIRCYGSNPLLVVPELVEGSKGRRVEGGGRRPR